MGKYDNYDPTSVAQGFARRDQEFRGWPVSSKPEMSLSAMMNEMHRLMVEVHGVKPIWVNLYDNETSAKLARIEVLRSDITAKSTEIALAGRSYTIG